MDAAAGEEATADILAKMMVLTSLFWVILECRVFWTPHKQCVDVCVCHLLFCFFILESLATTDFRRMEFPIDIQVICKLKKVQIWAHYAFKKDSQETLTKSGKKHRPSPRLRRFQLNINTLVM